MRVDGLEADPQLRGDLAIGEPQRELLRHLLLARAEHADPIRKAVATHDADDTVNLGDHLLVVFDLGVALLFGEAGQRHQYRRLYGPWLSVLHGILLSPQVVYTLD